MSTFADIVKAIQKISPTGIDEWKVIDKINKNPIMNIQDILIQSLLEHIRIQKNEIHVLKGEKIDNKEIQISDESEEPPKESIQETLEETPILENKTYSSKDTTWHKARKIDVQTLFQKKNEEAAIKIFSVLEEKKNKVVEKKTIPPPPTEEVEIQGNTNLIQQIMDMGPCENYQDYQKKYVSKVLKELEKMCLLALQDKIHHVNREIGYINDDIITLTSLVDTLFVENHKLIRFWEIYNDDKDYRLSKIGMDLFVFILENPGFQEYLALLTPQLLDTYEYLS